MRHVVFIRAANVGGKNVFRPALLARSLAKLGIVNVGAAGTFVVREKATAAAIRREILARLPFPLEIAVCTAEQIRELVRSDPFRGVALSKDQRGWVAALHGKPKAVPKLPLAAPKGRPWSVRVDRVEDGFALGLWRRRPEGFVFPNEVVEDALGVPATTRYWETYEKVCALAEE